ncbi:ABC transporter ATP-binding protein [Clostridium sp. AF18-27]|uniref:ABC transporter ATP-binding protein n=1 Tax=Enterocloster lavalensis TaxID=460384 RepID=UPI000E4B7A32|nr:ABC transporter ATP-binding protein [Enterocloster lavalensis]RHR48234.1 ABC transporter ATP-binding protein [Clostridium sp. AF18-27]
MAEIATVEMKQIRKEFPATLANDNVDFTAYKGEIHALLGENGAGKSTLMNILTGVLRPDGGEILINGARVSMKSPGDALALGIGMIYQHFKLVKPFTVAENIVLGMEQVKILKKQALEQQVKALSEEYKIDINPASAIWQLSIGEQQRVEILKVLYRKANILILDEPTAVLTPDEVRELFGTLRNMAAMGCTIIFITHKMNEVMEFADRITVLRDGRLVKALKKEETTEQELAQLMVGREISMGRRNTENTTRNESILRVKGLTVLNDKKLKAVNDLSFDLYAGEILGIAGVSGNGQKELMEALAGLRPTVSGHLEVRGEDISRSSPRDRIGRGVAFIPEDRYGFALIKTMTVTENASLKCYRKPEFCRRGVLNYRKLEQQAGRFIEEFEIKVGGPKSLVQSMSGGNAQKLILARETAENPSVILASYPVRGLDIKATESIHKILVQEKSRGAGVLLVSEDLDEIFQLSDRVAVMYEGTFMGILPVGEVGLEQIGMAMAGAARLGGEA